MSYLNEVRNRLDVVKHMTLEHPETGGHIYSQVDQWGKRCAGCNKLRAEAQGKPCDGKMYVSNPERVLIMRQAAQTLTLLEIAELVTRLGNLEAAVEKALDLGDSVSTRAGLRAALDSARQPTGAQDAKQERGA